MSRAGSAILIRHYFRPFGGRKILYIWEAVESDMQRASALLYPEIYANWISERGMM